MQDAVVNMCMHCDVRPQRNSNQAQDTYLFMSSLIRYIPYQAVCQ